jgi:hypothetical protein
VKGNFTSAHGFDGTSDFEKTIGLAAASAVATLAGLLQFKKQS